MFKHTWVENDGEITIEEVDQEAFSFMIEVMYNIDYQIVLENESATVFADGASSCVTHLKVSHDFFFRILCLIQYLNHRRSGWSQTAFCSPI